MLIFKTKPGIIGPNPSWICYHGDYMYLGDTLLQLIWTMIREWKHDRHLAM